MVKLATARESRFYGTRASRNRWEYVNAGLYVLGSILLMGGFAAQFSSGDAKSGLAVLGIGLLFVTLVNVHDLLAHMAGIDYHFALIGSDPQLALVELAVPSVQALGSILNLMGILIFLVQAEKGYDLKLERCAFYLLIVGPVLWVIGSIHNSCQIYETANGLVQILQKSVQIPFLMGSLLFLVGGIVNSHGHFGLTQHGLKPLAMQRKSWVWLGLYGSMLFFIGGLMNLVKVFKMQQMDGMRLEKLRGGAQERLSRDGEGQVPLISEEQRRRKEFEEPPSRSFPVPTPYKDALLSDKS